MTDVVLRRLTGACILVLLCTVGLTAAERISPPEAAELYVEGKQQLEYGQYAQAMRTFQELTGRFGNSPQADLFLFHRARSEYHAGRFSEATASFSYYIDRYRDKPELPYAWYFLANAQYRAGQSGRALRSYLQAYARSHDSRLDRLTTEAINGLLAEARNLSINRESFDDLPGDKRCRAIALVARELASRGEHDQAARLSEGCGNVDLSSYQDHLATLPNELTVAVAVPLSGELRAFGEEIMNGATIAAEILRQRGTPVRIKPYDTKGDPIDAGRIAAELSEGNVHMVVGPLTSEESAVASAVIRATELPLIAPAATQAGLTRLSTSSFQLSPNVELQGVRMAEYAVEHLDADSAFVFTPTTADHLRMTRAFIDRFEYHGGTIVAIEYYSARDTDFGPFIRDAKSIILGTHPDSTYFINTRGDTIETDGLPVHVDAIYAPGEASQIRLLLPQIQFYNVRGQLLGSDGWGDRAVYRLEPDITRGAVFPSAHLQLQQSEKYLTFASAFDARFARQPQRLANLGYDAVTLAGRGFPDEWSGRRSLIEYLKRVNGYHGASGTISFGQYRENIEMPLYRIENNDAYPLEDTITPPVEEETAAEADETDG